MECESQVRSRRQIAEEIRERVDTRFHASFRPRSLREVEGQVVVLDLGRLVMEGASAELADIGGWRRSPRTTVNSSCSTRRWPTSSKPKHRQCRGSRELERGLRFCPA